jgi:hypothetical protein
MQQLARGACLEKPISDGGKMQTSRTGRKRAARYAPIRAARRAVAQMRLQAGLAYTALQAALSRSPLENLTEALHQVVLRAEA